MRTVTVVLVLPDDATACPPRVTLEGPVAEGLAALVAAIVACMGPMEQDSTSHSS